VPSQSLSEDQLVEQHLPLVGYIVNEVLTRLPSHVERDDLVSAGLMGLVLAARAYDAATGVPFPNYARTRIRGAVVDELRSADWAPRGMRARARTVTRAEDQLTAQLGRLPRPDEVAAVLGATVDEVHSVRDDVARSMLSLEAFDGALDDQLSDEGGTPEDRLLHTERLAVLRAAVNALPERLQTVVRGVFLEERSMGELAAELDVTESRVSQLRSEAMALLRDGINSHLDPALVPKPERPGGAVARRREAYYAEVASRSAYALTHRRPLSEQRVRTTA
jgi:RNA polymerase sigma factor for flagellar operon FliA